MQPIFDEIERKLIAVLAEQFEKGNGHVMDEDECMAPFNFDGDSDRAWSLMLKMKSLGFFSSLDGTIDHKRKKAGYIGTISPAVVQAARAEAKRQEERADLVDQIKDRFRRNPFAAWTVSIVAVISATLVVANQVVQLLQNLGWMSKT